MKKKSLIDTLKSDETSEDMLKKIPCSLAVEMPCCKGKGYQLSVQKGLLQASICTCVKNCLACLGQAQKLDQDQKSKPCASPAPKKIVSIFNNAHIPARYANASLEGFSNNTGNGARIVNEVKHWLKSFDVNSGIGLSIGGPVGVGKTYLMIAITKELARRGVSVRFIDFFQLLAEIKAGYSDKKAEKDLIAPLLDIDVLVLDELGKGRNNDFELTILDQLIMGRYNAQKITLVSTNYLFKRADSTASFNRPLELEYSKETSFGEKSFGPLEERVGERIFSRIIETSKVLELSGHNMRPIIQKKLMDS